MLELRALHFDFIEFWSDAIITGHHGDPLRSVAFKRFQKSELYGRISARIADDVNGVGTLKSLFKMKISTTEGLLVDARFLERERVKHARLSRLRIPSVREGLKEYSARASLLHPVRAAVQPENRKFVVTSFFIRFLGPPKRFAHSPYAVTYSEVG